MYNWLVRQLCVCSGEDYFIICKCRFNIRIRFAWIGFFVVLVFAGCFTSAALFVAHLFHGSILLCVLAGAIWAMMITNLYLLLLYTISPSLLPAGKPSVYGGSGSVSYSFSYIFRLLLIIVLAIIIVQPLNVLLFAPSFDAADKYAAEIRNILHGQPLSWLVTFAACAVFLFPVYYKYRVRNCSQRNYEEDFKEQPGEEALLRLREELVDTADFQQLAQRIMTLDIAQVKTADFYFQKTLIELRMVLEEYRSFKQTYSQLLTQRLYTYNKRLKRNIIPAADALHAIDPARYQVLLDSMVEELREEELAKYEYWADAPFRTRRKNETTVYETEAALLKHFYKQHN